MKKRFVDIAVIGAGSAGSPRSVARVYAPRLVSCV